MKCEMCKYLFPCLCSQRCVCTVKMRASAQQVRKLDHLLLSFSRCSTTWPIANEKAVLVVQQCWQANRRLVGHHDLVTPTTGTTTHRLRWNKSATLAETFRHSVVRVCHPRSTCTAPLRLAVQWRHLRDNLLCLDEAFASEREIMKTVAKCKFTTAVETQEAEKTRNVTRGITDIPRRSQLAALMVQAQVLAKQM